MKQNIHKLRTALLSLMGIFLTFSIAANVYAVTPSYSVSSSYKSGKYYTQLQSVMLTGDPATDIVNIALSQNGYHEGGSRSDLSGSGSTDTGSTKYTEYSQTLHNASANADWCAYFVSWCARQAGIPTSIIPKTGGCGTMRNNAGTYYDVTSGYTPETGDLFLLEPVKNGKHYVAERDSAGIPNLSSHIGIVTKVSGGRMYFIEGNSNQMVRTSSIPLQKVRGNQYWIQGYMHPDYDYDEVSTITLSNNGATDTTTTNATLHGYCSKYAGINIDTCGLYLGTTQSDMKKINTETVSSGANNKDGGKGFDIWYNLTSELGQTLRPNTTYYYRFYCTYRGIEFKSNIASFTTNNTTQINNWQSYVYITKDTTLGYYESADSSTEIGTQNAPKNNRITCTKYADCSNGSRRFCCVSNNKEYWFTYDSSCMSVDFLASSITPSISQELILSTSEGSNECSFFISQSPSVADEAIDLVDKFYNNIVGVTKHQAVNGKRYFTITAYEPGTTTVTFQTYYSKKTTSIKVTVVDFEPPEYTEPKVVVGSDGYTVSSDVTDHGFEAFGIKTWLASEDSESIPIDWSSPALKVTDKDDGNPYTVTKNVTAAVSFKDYNNAAELYYTEIYVKDSSGNISCISATCQPHVNQVPDKNSSSTAGNGSTTGNSSTTGNTPVYPPAANAENITVARAKLKTVKRINAKKAKIKIKKQKGVKGYEILIARNKKFTSGRRTITFAKTQKIITRLKKRKVYYIKVRAYKINAQGQKIYGAYSAIKKIKKR